MTEIKLKETELKVNLFAQDRLTSEELLDWFKNYDNKPIALRTIMMYFAQARPTKNEIEMGIIASGQKDTFTAAVLLRKYSIIELVGKLTNLPDKELIKTFIFITAIFKIADTRRRETKCKDGCTHFWHNIK